MRVQLTVLYVAALGLLLTGAGLIVYHSLFALLLQTTDAALATEAAQVTAQLALKPAGSGDDPREAALGNAETAVAQHTLMTVDIPGLVTDPEYLRVARADTGRVLALSTHLQKNSALAAALAALPPPSRNRPRYAFAMQNEEDQCVA